jgi:hypothetical protein
MGVGSRAWGRDMRKIMRLCVAATVYMLILLASQGIAMSQERSKLVDTGVIFSAQQVERLPLHSLDVKSILGLTPPFWTPSPEEIALLEGELKPYLEGATPPEAKVIAARLGNYKRQYVGYTDGGKRLIFVNGFCEDHWKAVDTWRDRFVFVFDGGSCFFNVRYDLLRSQFEYLQINSRAVGG